MVTHMEAGKENMLRRGDMASHAKKTSCVQQKRYEGTQEDPRNCGLGYTMLEHSSSTEQHNTERGCEKVVQRQMDIGALINDILQHIPNGAVKLRNKLTNVGDEVRMAVTKLKSILDDNKELWGNQRQEIYQSFFRYYGINVEQADSNTCRTNMSGQLNGQAVSGIDFDEVFLRDESRLINQLNDIYATKTGGELLKLIAAGREGNVNPGVRICLGYTKDAPYTTGIGDETDEMLQGSFEEGFTRGRGTGTFIALNSEELSQWVDRDKKNPSNPPKEDPRVVLAHELIHALHAQMGVKPTWEMLVHAQFQPVSSMLDRWLDYEYLASGISAKDEFVCHYSQFKNATTADDVPVTGIRSDIKYPAPLKDLQQINENQIRRELKVKLRDKY